VSVHLVNEQPMAVDADGLRALAEAILAEEGYPESAEVTVALLDEDELAVRNERHLGRSGPTDVLAFPVEALRPGHVPETAPDGPPLMVGDVLIAPAYVRRQASESGEAFEREMALMVAHGILHLLGYDHEEGADAERMEARERELLAKAAAAQRR